MRGHPRLVPVDKFGEVFPFWKFDRALGAKGFIAGKEILQNQQEGASIHQDMMKRPYPGQRRIDKANEADSHQRRSRKVEVILSIFLKPLLGKGISIRSF